jgi:serine/threonine protein kinase
MSRRYESGSHQSYMSYPTQQLQQHGASIGPGENGHPSHQPNYHDSRGPPINPTDKGHARRSPLPAHHCQPQSHPELLQHPHRTWFEKCTPLTRTIAHYDRKEQIGEGTFGQVYKAICPSTGRIVALKKIRLSVASEGLPRTVIREIKILKALQHPNMVRMIEVVSSKGYEYLDKKDERSDEKKKDSGSSIELKSKSKSEKSKKKDRIVDPHEKYKGNLFLVLEYISHDLSGILDMGIRFELVQSKCIFRQLLSVLQYMHSQGYVHRDLKSSNILIDQYYRVKLADFGLARSMDTK